MATDGQIHGALPLATGLGIGTGGGGSWRLGGAGAAGLGAASAAFRFTSFCCARRHRRGILRSAACVQRGGGLRGASLLSDITWGW